MGKEYLGIEFGSTRIKAVLTDSCGAVLASGVHNWENSLKNGLWTYDEKEIFDGLESAIGALQRDYSARFAKSLSPDGMGISAMMHGYIALDRNGDMLVPFRTWRNTNAGEAAAALTKLFGVNIPVRWSIAHLYQAILDGEKHVKDIAYVTTLAGYVHYKLTGEKVLGVGDASGMFPIDCAACDYDSVMTEKFDRLIADKKYPWKLKGVLPEVLPAGKCAGRLNDLGAKLTGLGGCVGMPLCPPEGDAGTGMVATNSVKERTGNVSAGTSVFAMVVLSEPLKKLHTEIDTVTTPDCKPVAMVHCNNCTGEINAWANLFGEAARLFGANPSAGELYTKLFEVSQNGDANCGGIVGYDFISGEPVVGLDEGRPLIVRPADGKLNLADFMKSRIYSSLASLGIGMRILQSENVKIDEMCGHGGFFKTPKVGQRAMSAAVGAPVTVHENAGEGGAWGIALLAAFMDEKGDLPTYLGTIFAEVKKSTLSADASDRRDFAAYVDVFEKGLEIERKAVEIL